MEEPTPEQQFLGWCAQNPSVAKNLSIKLPREFFTSDGLNNFHSIVSGKIQDGIPSAFTSADAKDYLERQLFAYIGQEIGRAQKSRDTLSIQRALALLEDSRSELEPIPLQCFSTTYPEVREVIPTGIEPLDLQIRGLGRGELGICAAPPGRGKTNLLINFAVSAALSQRSVLYLSVADQGRDELIPRIDSCILEKPCPPEADADMLRQRHDEAIGRLPGRIWISDYTDRECNIHDIEKTIEACETDLVIVDHADDVVSPYSNDPSVTRHSLRSTYTTLKKFAVRFGIAMWTASQSNEVSWYMANAGIDSLSEAKVGKATGAAIILIITQDFIGSQTVRCNIAKARRNITERTIVLNIDHRICRIW